MTWVKIDDNFAEHPKILKLSDGAFRLYVTALCYANRYETDGKIDTKVARKLCHSRTIPQLIMSGLWHDHGDHYVINSYSDYQPTREKLENEREKTRLRVGRIRGAKSSTPVVRTYNDGSTTAPTRPDPKNKDIDQKFDIFWQAYPRKTAKGAARSAYLKALIRATAEEILEGALKFAKDPNRDPAFTPHGSTWLNHDRWTDEPLPERKRSVEEIKAQDLILARQRTEQEREQSRRAFNEEQEIARQAAPMPDHIKELFKRVPSET